MAEGFSVALLWPDLTVEDDCQQSPLSAVSVPHAPFLVVSFSLITTDFLLLTAQPVAFHPVCLSHTHTHSMNSFHSILLPLFAISKDGHNHGDRDRFM